MPDALVKEREIVGAVSSHKDKMKALSDADLKDKTVKFRERLAAGEKLNSLLPEAFAAMREASQRVLGMFPYDNQVLGAVVINQGNIVAMKTGEGKSITATMPLYLNALTGKGAILVTVNDYLAARDGERFGEVFRFMGLTTAIGVPDLGAEDFTEEEKREIYGSDIVYTTSNKLGFDYLLEHLSTSEEGKYLRPFNFVVIDEADAILLDLAQMPLVISGAPRVQSNLYPLADKFVDTLQKEIDYKYDESTGAASFTEKGIAEAERFYHLENLYDPENFRLNRHLNLAIRATEIFLPARDYMVMNDTVKLLSPSTGRLLDGNKLQGGLHQAIEAKEEIPISRENRAMASVTYQNLFVMFDKVSGMTGTAKGSEKELFKTYKTKVIELPTSKPTIRKDEPDIIVDTLEEKEKLVIEYVKKIHATGQPILLTTSSLKNSDQLSQDLLKEGISHNLLNALIEAKEAEIISEAGQKGMVTVATLMAGRGTDIRLGEGVEELGGLIIVGTEKMPNQRIEWQVRGRAGRMGEPGKSIFYTSMEDDLFVRFGSIKPEDLKKKKLSEPTKRRLMQRAQLTSEDSASNARDLSQKFDSAMIKQREIVYAERDRVMGSEAFPREKLDEIAGFVIDAALAQNPGNMPFFIQRFVFDNLTFHMPEEYNSLNFNNLKGVRQFLMDIFTREVELKKSTLAEREPSEKGPDEKTLYDRYQNLVFLKAIDEAWVEQVDFLEQLKTVVSDRPVAQHKVEYEYRKEAYYAFEDMKKSIYKEIVRLLCLSEFETKEDGSMTVQFA